MSRKLYGIILAGVSFALSGCEGTGSLSILLEAEDTITDGIEPGSGAENIKDGWAVSFAKYIVTIGDFDLHHATDTSVEAEAGDVFVVDLVKVPAGGVALWQLDDLREGRWAFNYSTPHAGHGEKRHDSVSETDFDAVSDNHWTYLIEGSITKTGGQSCPPAALATPGGKTPNGNTSSGGDACYDAPTVHFVIGADAETVFGPCEIDGTPGIAITAGQTTTATATIHGDHLFFNGFPEGDEGGISRLAQWLADADLNLDGTVTVDELEAIDPAQLPEFDERYQLGGAPIEVHDLYDYVKAQLKTQGHYQGEGECAVDGEEHDHGHDHG